MRRALVIFMLVGGTAMAQPVIRPPDRQAFRAIDEVCLSETAAQAISLERVKAQAYRNWGTQFNSSQENRCISPQQSLAIVFTVHGDAKNNATEVFEVHCLKPPKPVAEVSGKFSSPAIQPPDIRELANEVETRVAEYKRLPSFLAPHCVRQQ